MLALRGQSVVSHGQLVKALRQSGVDLQRFGTEHGLLRHVAKGHSLGLFHRPHRLPRRVDGRLGRDKVEVGRTDIGGDPLPFRPDTLEGDLSPQFGRADAESDLVLVHQRKVDVAGEGRRELRRSTDLRLRRRDRPGLGVGAKRTGREREVERLQQLAAEDGKRKLRKTLGARSVHAVILLLGLEHGVLHQPVRQQRDRQRVVQGQHGRVCVLRGCRPLLCQRHPRDCDEK